jgi:glycosyltransferase involved in cell wall biosynthesis
MWEQLEERLLARRMKIAIFDYFLDGVTPMGKKLQLLAPMLAKEHEVTVFSIRFDQASSTAVNWVRLRVPVRRPLLLLFMAYRVLANLYYDLHRLFTGKRYDVVQSAESNLGRRGIIYSQFCHSYYVKKIWPLLPGKQGIFGLARRLDHGLRAALEPATFRRALCIVVPSGGLRREIELLYPQCAHKIVVLPNPVNIAKFLRPADWRATVRQQWQIPEDRVLFCFVALGHYERKGLILALQALQNLADQNIGLMIIGGRNNLIARYAQLCEEMGIRERVYFSETLKDIRPYLWESNAFLFPSFYEAFPTSVMEAAASGLPVLSTPLNGVEDYLTDGQNGLLMERSVEGVTASLRRFLALSPGERRAMGLRARESMVQFTEEKFVERWRAVYARVADELKMQA